MTDRNDFDIFHFTHKYTTFPSQYIKYMLISYAETVLIHFRKVNAYCEINTYIRSNIYMKN